MGLSLATKDEFKIEMRKMCWRNGRTCPFFLSPGEIGGQGDFLAPSSYAIGLVVFSNICKEGPGQPGD